MEMILSLLVTIGVFMSGYILGIHHERRRPTIGVLRVDQSDPDDEPYLFLELTKKLPQLKHGDRVSFEVSTKNYISQE